MLGRYFIPTLVCALLFVCHAHAQETPPSSDTAVPPEESESSAAEGNEDPSDGDDDLLEDDDDDFDDEGDGGWDDDEPEPTFPRVELRGYYRFRADMFGNNDLGTSRLVNNRLVGTSGFRPPVTENLINNADPDTSATVGRSQEEDFLASANMRLRLQPTFHVTESLKFAATFDVLDNLVLGSTPDFDPTRPDIPLAAFSGSQAPPGSRFQFQDSIQVKELYGEWRILGMPLRFGRMALQWGLGMMANDGEGWDHDFGDYQDRVMTAVGFYGVYMFGGYDIVSSGPTYKQPFQPFGQAYDITETDDVEQGFFGIFMKPVSDEEKAKRRERLVKQRKPSFDWGLYGVFRRQRLDVDNTTLTDINENPETYDYDGVQLIERRAWAVIPDLWLKLEWRPKYTQYLRLELEAAFIYGEIEDVTPAGDPSSPDRTLMSWGVAFEGEFTTGGLTVGLDAGAASGDSAGCLTVLDCKNFEENGRSNVEITNFRFDRNYIVDMILFREVIGSVTNAWYVKPWIRYDLFESPEGAIGGRLDVEFAGALNPGAYPSGEGWLGTEIDVSIFVEETNKFFADLAVGVFIPGNAFDLVEGFQQYTGPRVTAEVAWTVQTHIVIQY